MSDALVDGKRLALVPFILSHLYHYLRNIVTDKMKIDYNGPLWLFQFQLLVYFPQLRSECVFFFNEANHAKACFKFFFALTKSSKEQSFVCCSWPIYPSSLYI